MCCTRWTVWQLAFPGHHRPHQPCPTPPPPPQAIAVSSPGSNLQTQSSPAGSSPGCWVELNRILCSPSGLLPCPLYHHYNVNTHPPPSSQVSGEIVYRLLLTQLQTKEIAGFNQLPLKYINQTLLEKKMKLSKREHVTKRERVIVIGKKKSFAFYSFWLFNKKHRHTDCSLSGDGNAIK